MSDIAMMRLALAKQSRLRLFESELCVLHAGAMDYVLGLNPSAALLMDVLAKFPHSDDDVVTAYAQGLGIDAQTAADFISMQVEAWRDLEGVFDTPLIIDANHPTTDAMFDVVIAFGGHPIRLCIHDSVMVALIEPVVAGLAQGGAPFAEIHVWRENSDILVQSGTARVQQTNNDLLARGEVLTALVEAAFPAADGFPHLHGATLRAPNGKQVLITGDSGQGKTTLALGLMGHGYALMADDFSIFDPRNTNLIPIHFNPSVKQGAWTPLEPLYPTLASLPAVDQGARQCKYLARSKAPKMDMTGAPADLIVFPNWGPNTPPEITPYDKGEAIMSLLRHSHLPQNRENLQAMLDYLANSDIWQVSYTDFKDAKNLIDAMLT